MERFMSGTDRVDAVIVLTTVSSHEDAVAIGRTLVEEQLAACVNVLPAMTSLYRWQGQVQSDQEHQLIIKTMGVRVEALRSRLHALHTYELPEFLVVPAVSGSDRYLGWIAESTASGG
jgi:periplasmic divalent cation tolerance protein